MTPPAEKPELESSIRIVIVGSGFSGIGMAIRLKQAGINDFILLERANDVGGVWRDNSYPGCACDVESQLYSFSFAPNPSWSRLFCRQSEIHAYLRDCAERFEIMSHLRFGQNLLAATWKDDETFWEIQTSKGRVKAEIFINATGAFSEALIPDLPGKDLYRGRSFHSATWDHSFDLKGKKVAVVGTGASAIQFIPEIQPLVKELTVYQRTAPWVMMRGDRAVTRSEQKRYAAWPIFQKLRRFWIYLSREALGMAFRNPKLIAYGKIFAKRHLHSVVSDPVLREKLTPAYEIGCKRILLSNDYYPALVQSNVRVETEAVKTLTENGIRMADGHEESFDAIIWGTGFRVTDYSIADIIVGKSGRSLKKHWSGSPSSFLGTTTPDFPNLFFLLGPNTGLGHSSVVLMIEAQIELVRKTILYMLKNSVQRLEVRTSAEEGFRKEIDDASQNTVWVSGGCKSWYLDKNGRNSTLWPGSIGAFRRRLLPFDPKDYHYGPLSGELQG